MATGEAFTDEGAGSEATSYYYSAWSFSSLGYSTDYATVHIGGTIMILLVLALLPLGLTIAMFATKNSMLGFPASLFWAIFGGYAYTQSTVPWGDWQYFLAFASLLGMVTFTALAAYGLRERRDTIADAEMDEEGEGEGSFIDEPSSGSSKRVKALRKRAEGRRSRKNLRDEEVF